MPVKKKILISVISLGLLVGSCVGTYFLTRHMTFKTAYAAGKNTGYKTGQKIGYSKGYDAGWGRERQLLAPNASSSYQSLSPATAAPATVVSPTHCTSTTYGINGQFTSTNCN